MTFVPDTTPGRAVWKFVVGERFIYRRSNKLALKLFLNMRDFKQFDVYSRSNPGWKYEFTHVPPEFCSCGRSYSDSPNGTVFKWQDMEFRSRATIKDLVYLMSSPILCAVCYYRKEYNEGRFCPKWVKERLEY